MRKIVKAMLSALMILQGSACLNGAFAGETSQALMSEQELTATVSTDDAELEAEAARLGVPDGEVKRYVVDMKSMNKRYEAGSLTTTEYVRAKRDLIENLK